MTDVSRLRHPAAPGQDQAIDSLTYGHGVDFACLSCMKRLHGYTLVEIAIVLLVLALLLGGLLKWQSVEDGQAQNPAAMPE